MRFEPDKRKHIADYGAQCILEAYIARWKLRVPQNPDEGANPQNSASSEALLQDESSTQANLVDNHGNAEHPARPQPGVWAIADNFQAQIRRARDELTAGDNKIHGEISC